MTRSALNIGFISTRFSGTDGVSLEVDKWVHVLEQMGHSYSCFCGQSDWSADKSYVVDEAHFDHPEIAAINRQLFQEKRRTEETTRKTDQLKRYLKDEIRSYVNNWNIDVLIAENAWSLPMNVPLGLALSEYVGDCDIPAIAHHHDFWWDRERFLGAPVDDYLSAGFPSTLERIEHVVINSVDKREISYRCGVSPTLIPNVMNFEHPPPETDEYAADLREVLSITDDQKFILQPTRIVPRKEIEMSIELVRYLQHPAKLVITHEAGDEGMEYLKYLKKYADVMDVDVAFASDLFAQHRQTTDNGSRIFSLRDAYQQADLVTYPSRVEGFGNAFLETIYYGCPLVMQDYEIFKLDIEPKGFKVITIDEFIRSDVVDKVDGILENPDKVQQWCKHNYELGRRYYSFKRLEKQLDLLLKKATGELY